MKITYPGPLAAVKVLATGQTVARGETADVPDDVAAQLIEQGWTVPAPKPPKAVKATTTKADEAATEEDA